MNQLDEIKSILTGCPDGKEIFPEPVQAMNGARLVFTAYGAWLGPDGVYVMDGGGDWHGPLHESQVNASYVIESIHNQLSKNHASPVTNQSC